MSLNDDLKKGFYSLFSNYGVPGDKPSLASFQKKGSEIKIGMANIISNLNKAKSGYMEAMGELMEAISFPPTDPCQSNEEFHHRLDFVPKRYSYDSIYNGKPSIDTSKGIEERVVIKPTDEQADMMRRYNDIVYQYMDAAVSKLKLESMKNNIEDGKNYTLNSDQLTILGI